MTARYNGFYYARESLKDGKDKIEKENKDDFSKIIPVYINTTNESSKTIFPEMDRAIKKASLCISRHAIKDKKTKTEIPGSGKWIDNCWVTIGKSHFYKREFFSGIEALEYVARTYKTNERYDAYIWLIRSFNELNTLSQSEPYISLIKNDKKFPKEYRDDFASLYAEFLLKQGLYDETIKQLTTAILLTKKKSYRARYNFILAQLYEQKNDNKKAIFHYKKSISLKPNYDMVFNAKIKQARLHEGSPQELAKVKRELRRMLKDIKNEDFLDVIYYTLGELEEKEKQLNLAIEDYKKSALESTTNNFQKAKSYLRLGEIYFDKTEYSAAEAYYDSTVMLIKEDFPGYADVVNKKKSLGTLVMHLRTISKQDSLLKIAAMDTASRNNLIRKMIAKIEADEAKQKELDESIIADNAVGNNTGNQVFAPTAAGEKAGWYFYNQQTRSFGINDFIKKWGNRKLEDNWRRLNKQIVMEALVAEKDPLDTTSVASADTSKKNIKNAINKNPGNKKSISYYLRELPLTPSDVDSSNKKIIEAYYTLGSIYKEQLNNNKRSIEAFETLNRRYPKNKYEPSDYYQMYRIYLAEKKEPKANECKNFLLTNYPNSDYSKIINDPDFAKNANAKKGEVESFYTETYKLYLDSNYAASLQRCNEAIFSYGKNDFSAKFAFLRALNIGRSQHVDSLERALIMVTVKYPADPVYKPAKAMLDAIKKMKTAAVTSTNITAVKDSVKTDVPSDEYVMSENAEHYWVAAIPEREGDVEKIKTRISDFNGQYYSTSGMMINTIPIDKITMVATRPIKNKAEAQDYFNLIGTKTAVFGEVTKEKCFFFVISAANLTKLIKKKKVEDYMKFFTENYEIKQ